jgi:tetratricopeptide (TPR) repeat protein
MKPKKSTENLYESAVANLSRAIRLRKVLQAKRQVDNCIELLETATPEQKGAIQLTALCAWAIDLYGPYLERVEAAVLRFKKIPPGELTLHDLASLIMAEGLVKYHQEKYQDAKSLFEEAKADADRIGDTELMTISRYYLGRTLFKLTCYESAIEYITDAKSRDLAAGNRARAASMELDNAWLYFLIGEVKEAQLRLNEARLILAGQQGAFVDQGNALSFQGRLFREDGQYQKALDCYFEALKAYGEYDPSYRNVARCRRNIAVIYRILVRELFDRVKISPTVRSEIELRIEELRSKAFEELRLAREIYEFDPDRYHHGLGIVHITLALLYFDAGELDRADEEAQHAYKYGRGKGDKIVMAEARVIQSQCALEGYRSVNNAERALKLANEAIQLAEQTDRHRRLLVRAYICKGQALLESPHNNTRGAQRCCDEARTYLVPEDRDYLRDMLDDLERNISLKGHVSSLSIQLTDADLAELSLTEITEKVEEQVLRYAYERCGRSVAKTCNEMHTGAYKVRRAISIYKLTDEGLKKLEAEGVDQNSLAKLTVLKNREIQGRANFEALVREKIGGKQRNLLKLIRKHVSKWAPH